MKILCHLSVVQVEEGLYDVGGEVQAESEECLCDFSGRFDSIQASAHIVEEDFKECSELFGHV